MKKAYLVLIFSIFIPFFNLEAASSFLNTEEIAWLKARDNTITVVPERNTPPFSYNGPDGVAQGIFIDYIETIAKKLDIKIKYLSARTRIDVINSVEEEGNEYVITIGVNKAKELGLLSTKPYFTTPVIIAVREDYDIGKGLKLEDFNNKKVSVLAGSATQSYVKRNYPKVLFEGVVDNELALHRVVLAEVDAAVINMASLKYYLSTQTLSSTKVAGTIPGLDVNFAFVVSKDQAILNSILEKGLAEVSPQEQTIILNKWQSPQVNKVAANSKFGVNNIVIVVISSLALILILLSVIKSKNKLKYSKSNLSLTEMREKIELLKKTNKEIAEELETIEDLESGIEQEIQKLK